MKFSTRSRLKAVLPKLLFTSPLVSIKKLTTNITVKKSTMLMLRRPSLGKNGRTCRWN